MAAGTPVTRWLQYAAVQAVSATVGLMPMRTVRRCGRRLGALAFRVDAFHRRIALENLRRAFPGKNPGEVSATARAVFEHFGSLLLELMRFAQLSSEQMQGLIDTEGEERVWQAYSRGRGVLFFTGHFGYWEMQATTQPLRVKAVSVLARPLDNPRLHRMLEHIRTRTGNTVIYRQGALRKVLRALSENRGVALLIDQHLQTDAVQVDFFGRPAATTSALAALALRTGASVIPVFALPLPDGRYRFVYERPVDPPPEDSPQAVQAFTQRCTDVLEMYVRRHPDLWLWMHRRWRDAGPGPATGVLPREGADADV